MGVYIIGEIGINHNGKLACAFEMIDAAAQAGADCVKFQFFQAKNLYPKSAGRLQWKDDVSAYSYDIFKAVKKFELPEQWISRLIRHSAKNKVDFLTSVFDVNGLRTVMRKGLRQIKISSYSITNLPLLESSARYKIPIIMSTGGATLGEIERSVGIINQYHNKLSLLHCSAKYPTSLSECNLGVIQTLRHAFANNKIGYSDHTREVSDAAVGAVLLGAQIIEKHITLDKKMAGPDHFFALEPRELNKMVRDIRNIEKKPMCGDAAVNAILYGSSVKRTFENERYMRDFCYPAIFSARKIKKGERISCRDLRILRVGKKRRGFDPMYLSLFKKYRIIARRNINAEEAVNWDTIF